MVLRNQFKADGSFDKLKARLVAQGFSQKPGIHFNESFRTAVALAARHGMSMEQLDVTSAYLQGKLEETIFMELPKQLFLEYLVEDSGTDKTTKGKARRCFRN